jgi:hypothetical protein
MPSLPTPGVTTDWGDNLNEFLEVAHNADGTLKSSAIESPITKGFFYISGSYYGPQAGPENAGGGFVGDALRLMPMIVFKPVTFDRIGMNHWNAVANAGSVYRMGVWRWDSAVLATLMLDAGTVALDTAVNRKELTISLALQPGVYLVGGAAQNFSGSANFTRCLLNSPINALFLPRGYNGNFTIYSRGFERTGVSGAFSNLTLARSDFETANDIPFTWLRAT